VERMVAEAVRRRRDGPHVPRGRAVHRAGDASGHGRALDSTEGGRGDFWRRARGRPSSPGRRPRRRPRRATKYGSAVSMLWKAVGARHEVVRNAADEEKSSDRRASRPSPFRKRLLRRSRGVGSSTRSTSCSCDCGSSCCLSP
jgi:hypothetical protein